MLVKVAFKFLEMTDSLSSCTLLLGLPLDPRWKGWDDILKVSKLKSDAHAVQVKASYVPVTVDFERYADTTSASQNSKKSRLLDIDFKTLLFSTSFSVSPWSSLFRSAGAPSSTKSYGTRSSLQL